MIIKYFSLTVVSLSNSIIMWGMCKCSLVFMACDANGFFFSVRLLSVMRWSFGFFIPATTANDLRLRRIFYPRLYPLHLVSYLNSWERASFFPFECSVLNKGTTGTIFITSLVWRGPWLGIEPGTSRTRRQHSTTRLSRRRYYICKSTYVIPAVSHYR